MTLDRPTYMRKWAVESAKWCEREIATLTVISEWLVTRAEYKTHMLFEDLIYRTKSELETAKGEIRRWSQEI